MSHIIYTTAGKQDAEYFIVLDKAPIKRHPTPTYDLLEGNPDEATGFKIASSRTIKALLQQVPEGEKVYRVYLHRTEGKTGKKLIKR